MRTKQIGCALLIVFFWAVGCSVGPIQETENTENGGPKNEGTNSSSDSDTTSFEVEVIEDNGDKSTDENEIPDEAAGETTSGAFINGDALFLFLVAPGGAAIDAVIETREDLRAPGSFTVGAPPEGTFTTRSDSTDGAIYESTSGQIVLDNCPEKTGDKVKGRFEQVVVVSPFNGQRQTLDGEFSVAVYDAQGALFCNAKNANSMTANHNNAGGVCQPDYCDQGGMCCPYVTCLANCEYTCLTSDPDCADPFNANPAACERCVLGCIDECNVPQDCVDALVHLDDCEERAGCSELEDDEAKACSEGACCVELQAVY